MSDVASPLTVLVTGGSSGLGLELARQFIARGHTVFACGRDEARLADAVATTPGLHAVTADVGLADDRRRLLDNITAAGSFDVLVNNAALSHAHDYTDDYTLAEDRAAEELAVNFAAPIELSRMFLAWRRTNGREQTPATIAMISTPGALFPLEANPLYAASKAGLHSFTLALRWQLRDTPVSVVEVFPPALATGLSRELDVPAEADNGPEAVLDVARRSVDGILAGERTVLPHPQSEQLYSAFGREFSDNFMAKLNSGVTRQPDWNRR
jgi:uncharacterized oxidoreductase